CQHSYNIPLSF
nr:immunoglobulin light chain junction region [Macaca mulatta]